MIFLETLFSVDLVDLGDLEKHISVLVYLVSAAGDFFLGFQGAEIKFPKGKSIQTVLKY